MAMRIEAGLVVAVLALAGCTPVEMRGDNHAPRECHNEPLKRFVGRPGDAGAIEAARRASGARSVRVMRPGESMTMDFRADRLTVVVDEHRIIARASCG
jgi:hypothetical protein